ncbi:hypothetical protein Gogos_022149 [Gossypium gossypioides]|uniref:Uncharacterized protein n=1 Tax=Gossypium gossypioides TaxID=34282 RepID=A0A7J9D0N0_GOSGO|nr:hypothetical protein [Gossypium gossypioides]
MGCRKRSTDTLLRTVERSLKKNITPTYQIQRSGHKSIQCFAAR